MRLTRIVGNACLRSRGRDWTAHNTPQCNHRRHAENSMHDLQVHTRRCMVDCVYKTAATKDKMSLEARTNVQVTIGSIARKLEFRELWLCMCRVQDSFLRCNEISNSFPASRFKNRDCPGKHTWDVIFLYNRGASALPNVDNLVAEAAIVGRAHERNRRALRAETN